MTANIARALLGRASPGQIAGVEIITRAAAAAGADIAQTAYILATAAHETGRTMQPVREGFAPDDATARRIVANLCASRGRSNYAAEDPETGQSYYGRGYVQLTHRRNYARMGELLGMDLERQPDLALQPQTAATILAAGMMRGDFTGRPLSAYVAGERRDWREARRVVNGLDRADDIAAFATAVLPALQADRAGQWSDAPPTQPPPPVPRPSRPAAPATVTVATATASAVTADQAGAPAWVFLLIAALAAVTLYLIIRRRRA